MQMLLQQKGIKTIYLNYQIQKLNSTADMSYSNPSLSHLLKDKDITPRKLFSQKNIASQIKNNIQTFVKFALRHKQFIYECFDITLNSTYQQLAQDEQQNIAFNISQVLCCDESAMAELLFQPNLETAPNNSQICQNIIEQQADNIQSQAQRLFQSDPPQQNIQANINQPIQILKDQLAKKSLQILQKQNINQSCLGYLYKIWAFLIRNDANKVIQFFNNNRQCYELLIKNLHYYSISNLLAQLIVSQDRTKQYKYQNFKKEILHTVIDKLLKQKQNQLLYDGISIFLQQVLNNSKQSYYEYFQDFKRQVNYVSSAEVVEPFYSILFQKSEITFKNALKYLQLILQRINSQKQQKDMYRDPQSSNQPSMIFQIDILFKGFINLIKLVSEIDSFTSVTKIHYLTFLFQIIKASQFQKNRDQIDHTYSFQILMNAFRNQSSKGLYKIKLSKLLQQIIKNCRKEQIQKLLQSQQTFFQSYFSTTKALNFQNTKQYNKNENIAFQCKILFEIDNKIQNSVDVASKKHNKNFKRIQKKYDTKIANFGKSNKNISFQEEGGFFNFNQSFESFKDNTNNSRSQSSNSGESNLVGKNNISIPVLHLPQSLKIKKENNLAQRKAENSQKIDTDSSLQSKLNKFKLQLRNKEQQIKSEQLQVQQQCVQKEQNLVKMQTETSTNSQKFSLKLPLLTQSSPSTFQNFPQKQKQSQKAQNQTDPKKETVKIVQTQTQKENKKNIIPKKQQQLKQQKLNYFLKHSILLIG